MLRRLKISVIVALVCQQLLFVWGWPVVSELAGGELPLRPPAESPTSATPPGDELVVASIVLTIARQAEIPARDDGVLAELLVQEGRAVQAGEVVGKLDDEAIRLAYHRAVLEVERAQKIADNDTKVRLAAKELQIAQSEYRRASEAEARFSKSVTEAELERLKLEVDRAVLAREQAQFEWDTARTLVRIHENEVQSVVERARRRRMTSPLAGTVAAIARRPGEWLETGQVVMRVIATDVLRAEGFLSAEQLGNHTPMGCKATLTVELASLRNETFPGVVVFVSPEIDPVSGQVRMWADIENRDGRLRPGLAGRLVIETSSGP